LLLPVELQSESCTLKASASAPEALSSAGDSPSPEEYSFEAEQFKRSFFEVQLG